MLPYKALLSLALLSLPIAGYSVCTATYTDGAATGNWGDPSNWGGSCYPGQPGDTMGDSATFTGNGTLYLTMVDASSNPITPIITTLTYSTPMEYVIQPDSFSNPMSTLTFIPSGGNATISVTADRVISDLRSTDYFGRH